MTVSNTIVMIFTLVDVCFSSGSFNISRMPSRVPYDVVVVGGGGGVDTIVTTLIGNDDMERGHQSVVCESKSLRWKDTVNLVPLTQDDTK